MLLFCLKISKNLIFFISDILLKCSYHSGKKLPKCRFANNARVWSVVSSFVSEKEDYRSVASVNRTARTTIVPGIISRPNRTETFGYSRDVSAHILSYVPNVRDLYNLSMVNKLIRDIIQLDIDLVIGCALRHGGRPFQTVANIANLVEKHAIYVPSPLRLLRQVNGVYVNSASMIRHLFVMIGPITT